MQTRLTRFLENFILFAIILVLIQTFLEDYAVLMGWSWDIRKILIISGFVFDLIFTLEFFTRSIYAASLGRFGRYIFEDRGWIDFLASVPLLLFNSGPELFALITGAGAVLAFGSILNVLKVVKAIRIARVLRLLRVLKIFRRIKNTESVMAQRHVARISTMVVSTVVITLLLFAVFTGLLNSPDVQSLYEQTAMDSMNYIARNNLADANNSAGLSDFASSDPMILQVRQDGHIRYNGLNPGEILAPTDYGYVKAGSIELYLDLRNMNVSDARNNIGYFFLIIALVLMLMFLYSPHFALTISDPIHVMRKGFDDAGYNLEVRIPESLKDDEVYRLASSYNINYLPLKDREHAGGSSSVLDLSMDEFIDLGNLDDAQEDYFSSASPAGESSTEDSELIGVADIDSFQEDEILDFPEEEQLDTGSEDSGLSFDSDFPDVSDLSSETVPEEESGLSFDADGLDEPDHSLDSDGLDESDHSLDKDILDDSEEDLDLDAGIQLDGIETGLDDLDDFDLDDDFSFDEPEDPGSGNSEDDTKKD